MLYKHFGRVLTESPIPKELKNDKEMIEVYKSTLAEQAEPLETKAQDGFELAASKARELGVRSDCATRSMQAAMVKKPELGPTLEALPAVPAVEFTGRPQGYGLLAALEPAPPPVKRSATPARGGGVAPAPALQQPAPGKAQKKAGAKGKEAPPAPPRTADDPLPRPKKGDDEDLLQ